MERRSRVNRLRPYQQEVALAVLDSILNRRGLTFSVEISRQGGKNELSAQLEVLLLTLYMNETKNIVKCAPTFKPQVIISMLRLKERLNEAGFNGIWTSEMGYIIRLGKSRAIFLSADNESNVVGNTAHILLEVDEAQDVGKDKYTKEFKPMGSTTNCTSVLYGTTWDEATLLEETKQVNLELEKKDGIKRHFRYDWQEVAKYNPDYEFYVASERERLGEEHPLFRTQYALLPLRSGGGFLSREQIEQLKGEHPRKSHPEAGRVYVAGIDIAGEAEGEEDATLRALKPKKDSTVVTVAELDFPPEGSLNKQPVIRVIEHYFWTGRKHSELYPKLVDLIKSVWKCRRVVIDASGMGQPVYSFLREALGTRVTPFTFTPSSKSELGFNLLAVINSGRLKVYQSDGSPEFQEFWFEIERAKTEYRLSRTMNFYVAPSQGHDDFLMSLALTVEAGKDYSPREARGSMASD